MENQKIASEEVQIKRAKSSMRFAIVAMFVVCMSVPIVNLLFGLFFMLWLSMSIIGASARRSADFGWLLLGAALCLFGFFLPVIFEGPTASGMLFGWTLEAALNVAVAVFIVLGRLGHLLFKPETA
ncbi:hypothetical protein OIV36_28075 [Burkholderia pseudomallei]|uniref:hypothetical protein n=1 Tax=Burkholderia pseudomallei TaxID=28450 RepID=UPI0021F7D28E|nr:hypothetical protein [Burkholderia pseudomallei]MCW0053338.1 hypothetical protein [Burkholderia pseudomallei]